uniref:Putative secreted protein n=1 Tax=Lutzomyia longipalpis TaxID=7200 RepID=A0A1B0CMQ9_LUTLO
MFLVVLIFSIFTGRNIGISRAEEEPQQIEDSTISAISDELFPDFFNSTEDYIVVTLPPNITDSTDVDVVKSETFPDTKQIAFPNDHRDPNEDKRAPCRCNKGICACCTGMLMDAFKSKGCMNLRYIPEDFAFHFEMKMNDRVLYKNRVSGKNPPPICVNPPRIGFIEVCANFYDIYFVGRNMHVCLEMGGYFQGFELFSRSFDCLRMGDKGVKVMKPEDDQFRPTSGTLDAEVDQGDDIDDYDENVVRRFDKN